MHDIRDAWRALAATPIVSTLAVVSLALGIGANTAIFSILNSLMLRTLPVRDAQQLLAIAADGEDDLLDYPVWIAVREHHLLDGAFAWARDGAGHVENGETRVVNVLWASGSFFDTLGVPAALGRTLRQTDDRRGGGPDGPVAMIGDRFWRQRLNADPGVIGRTITLDRAPFTIVGITPPRFFGLEIGARFDVVLPLETEPLLGRLPTRLKQWPWLHVGGRLPQFMTLTGAEAAVRAAQPEIRAATMPAYERAADREAYLRGPWTLRPAATGTSRLRSRYAMALETLWAVAALVLLIGCANVANLQLARTAARRYERSVRAALGASPWRVARPVLFESILLAAAGTAIGMLFARWAGPLVVAQLSTWISTTELDLSPDVRMLSASMLAMIATVVVFGTAPMLLARRTAPIDAMKRQQGGEPARAVSLREALVVVQVALCLLLLVGAALFARSFAALAYRDLGFDRASVLVAPVDSTYSRIPASDRLSLYERLRAAAAAVPGVRRVALSMATPLGNAGVRFTPAVAVETGPVDWTRAPRILTNMIGPGWFETYGTHLIAGRDFTAADTNGSPEVVIVNEAFARKFFAGAVPVGRTMRMSRPGLSSDGHVTVDVVALVENAAFTSARNAVEPTLYRPLAQVADARLLKAIPSISISVQAEPGIAPSHLQTSVSQVITAIDGDLEVTPVPVKAQLDAGYVRERLLGLLSGFFAMLGLALAAIGVYAVTSQSVHGRRRELGIRMALGADGASLVRLVVRRFALLAATGAAIGGVASLWAGGAVASLLFGVTAGDPFAFTLAAVTALVTCSVAGWLPARRAARIEPMIVLRES